MANNISFGVDTQGFTENNIAFGYKLIGHNAQDIQMTSYDSNDYTINLDFSTIWSKLLWVIQITSIDKPTAIITFKMGNGNFNIATDSSKATGIGYYGQSLQSIGQNGDNFKYSYTTFNDDISNYTKSKSTGDIYGDVTVEYGFYSDSRPVYAYCIIYVYGIN